MDHPVAWIVLSGIIVSASALYWRGVTERNHLTYYIGMLLLDDFIRAEEKGNFESLLLKSKGTTVSALSIECLSAIQREANLWAAGKPKGLPPKSSLLVFERIVWERKQALGTETNRV